MKLLIKVLVPTAILLAGVSQASDQKACPKDGVNSPAELHRAWIMEGWEKKPGDKKRFAFDKKLGRFYDLDAPGVFYDDFAPDFETAYTPAQYGQFWEGPFNAMRSALHGLHDEPQAIVGDRVASSTLGFVGRLEARNGEITAIKSRSQLGWECSDGRWVIRHEHNSSQIVPEDEIKAYIGRQDKS